MQMEVPHILGLPAECYMGIIVMWVTKTELCYFWYWLLITDDYDDDDTKYNAANDDDDDDANDDVLRYEHLCCCRACGKYWSSFFGPHTPFENIASGSRWWRGF